MAQIKNTPTTKTLADYIIKKLKDEKSGLENAIAFLRASFLSSAVDALFSARRKAGLTQEQVAQKLGKKQEAIARWEADKEGKMSLRQYFDLAAACGRIPLNIALEPIESVRDFVIDHPEELQAPELYYSWLRQKSAHSTASQTFTGQTIAPASKRIAAMSLTNRYYEDQLYTGCSWQLYSGNTALPQSPITTQSSALIQTAR